MLLLCDYLSSNMYVGSLFDDKFIFSISRLTSSTLNDGAIPGLAQLLGLQFFRGMQPG